MAAGILLRADLNLQAEARRKVRREEVRLRGVFVSRLKPRLGGQDPQRRKARRKFRRKEVCPRGVYVAAEAPRRRQARATKTKGSAKVPPKGKRLYCVLVPSPFGLG